MRGWRHRIVSVQLSTAVDQRGCRFGGSPFSLLTKIR